MFAMWLVIVFVKTSEQKFQLHGVESQLLLFDGLDHGFIGQAA